MKIYFYQPNILVIKTTNPDQVKTFFECMGLKFEKEKHGDGPEHYAAEGVACLLEIYPDEIG